MEAIILAGGLGTRLRSVVSDVPKPLAPVGDRPFLALLLDHLERRGVTRAVLAVGYLAEKIVEALGHRHGEIEIEYSVERERLGTGGAIRQALRHCRADTVVVMNGDTWLDVDLRALLAAPAPGEVAMTVTSASTAGRFGRVEVDGRRITAFRPAGSAAPGLVNSGVYAVPRALGPTLSGAVPMSWETEVLPGLVDQQRLVCFRCPGEFIDIGVPEDYERFCRMHGAKRGD